MIGKDKGDEKDQEKEKIRKRIHAAVDRDFENCFPAAARHSLWETWSADDRSEFSNTL